MNPGTNGCPLNLTLWPNGGCLSDWAAKNLVLNYQALKDWVDDTVKDCGLEPPEPTPAPDGGPR